MTTVVLHGEMALAVGRSEWKLDIKTPGEALRAIEANTRKLFAYLAKASNGYAEYRVLIEGADHTHECELYTPICRKYKRIDFVPVPKGTDNSGGWLAVIGVVLMIVAVALAIPSGGTSIVGATTFTGGLFGGTIATTVFTLGLAIAVGGISQMILGNTAVKPGDKPQNTPSDLFSGPVNTYHQGNPVPLGYGRLRVGSAIISASIRTLDIAEDSVSNPIPPFLPSTGQP